VITLRLADQSRSRQQAITRQPLPCGYVLAGGASTRFGRDKALVELGGQPMLVNMLNVLAASGVRQTLVIGEKARYGKFGSRCIKDKWPGEGPLGGIITALLRSLVDKYGYHWNVIVSCDMPFVTREWLAYMITRAAKKSRAEVIVPESNTGLEPLCACWHTTGVKKLQIAFAAGVRKVTDAMKRLQMEVIDEAEWKRFDTAGRLFWNMNTLADYREAQKVLQAGHR
jgi:molybdenum cofactor guanylyltransferase